MQRAFDRFTGFEEEFPSRIVAFSHWKMRFRPTTTSNTRWRAGSSSWFDGYSSRNSSCTYPRLSLPCIALASQEINPSDVTFEFSRRKGRIIIHFCTEVRFFYKFVKFEIYSPLAGILPYLQRSNIYSVQNRGSCSKKRVVDPFMINS